jgi:hypothetical protein
MPDKISLFKIVIDHALWYFNLTILELYLLHSSRKLQGTFELLSTELTMCLLMELTVVEGPLLP